jgi:hypothetical protein
MEAIKKYIVQQELLNKLNKNQIDFFNSIYDDVNRTSNKTEKDIKLEILQQLINDYQSYKISQLFESNIDKKYTDNNDNTTTIKKLIKN